MNRFEAMGIGRSLEPVNSILQPAWKIDNDMRLRPGELLIDVKIININLTSFNEIGEETEFDEVLFRRRILEIRSYFVAVSRKAACSGDFFQDGSESRERSGMLWTRSACPGTGRSRTG